MTDRLPDPVSLGVMVCVVVAGALILAIIRRIKK